MGGTNPDREAGRVRTEYFAAAQRFARAFASMLAVGVPIDPGRGHQVREWTRADVNVLRELHAALGEVLETRQRWDRMRRSSRDLQR